MYYNRNDRKVLLWLLATIVMCCVAFFLFDRYDTKNIAESMNDSLEVDSTKEYGKGYNRHNANNSRYARQRAEYQQQLNDDLKELEAIDDIQTAHVKTSVAKRRQPNQRWCIHDTERMVCQQYHATVP